MISGASSRRPAKRTRPVRPSSRRARLQAPAQRARRRRSQNRASRVLGSEPRDRLEQPLMVLLRDQPPDGHHQRPVAVAQLGAPARAWRSGGSAAGADAPRRCGSAGAGRAGSRARAGRPRGRRTRRRRRRRRAGSARRRRTRSCSTPWKVATTGGRRGPRAARAASPATAVMRTLWACTTRRAPARAARRPGARRRSATPSGERPRSASTSRSTPSRPSSSSSGPARARHARPCDRAPRRPSASVSTSRSAPPTPMPHAGQPDPHGAPRERGVERQRALGHLAAR